MPKTQVPRKGDGGQATAPQATCTHERETGRLVGNSQKIRERLKRLVEGMPDRSRLILLMSYGNDGNDGNDELSFEEIAAVLGEDALTIRADRMVLIGGLRKQLQSTDYTE